MLSLICDYSSLCYIHILHIFYWHQLWTSVLVFKLLFALRSLHSYFQKDWFRYSKNKTSQNRYFEGRDGRFNFQQTWVGMTCSLLHGMPRNPMRQHSCLRQSCHLAFFKLFARNKMVWPFDHFWPFSILKKIVNLKAVLKKSTIFLEILILNLIN